MLGQGDFMLKNVLRILPLFDACLAGRRVITHKQTAPVVGLLVNTCPAFVERHNKGGDLMINNLAFRAVYLSIL